ncbi:MAG TPA: hypothetical protein PLV57_01915 [Phycisphaerae bacterium]|nr:hypothetical protein [Phycisphaerae bacterium]HPP25246.1 hypothetical protein [Phycisphaerae bacterium]
MKGRRVVPREGVIVVPVYMHCPHCDHPQIVPVARRGRMRFCRQCGRAYVTSKVVDMVQPVPISSMAEMHAVTAAAPSHANRRVWVVN